MPKDAMGNQSPFVFIKDPTTVASGGTRAEPSSADDGVDITGATGLRVIISAPAGQTLDGDFDVRIWLRSLGLGRWIPNSQLHYGVSLTEATWRDDVREFASVAGFGRVFAQVVGPTTSGAGVVTTQYEVGVLG